jgi:hypothetical protein
MSLKSFLNKDLTTFGTWLQQEGLSFKILIALIDIVKQLQHHPTTLTSTWKNCVYPLSSTVRLRSPTTP